MRARLATFWGLEYDIGLWIMPERAVFENLSRIVASDAVQNPAQRKGDQIDEEKHDSLDGTKHLERERANYGRRRERA